MIIKHTKDNLKILPVDAKKCPNAIAAGVKNIILLPGPNQIDDKIWEEVKEFCKLQKQIDEGKLIEIKEKVTVKEVFKDKACKDKEVEQEIEISDITKMSIKKARELVEDCVNKKTLEAWREKESRADIRNLIDDQIKSIKSKGGERE
jgi:hypothetical protein